MPCPECCKSCCGCCRKAEKSESVVTLPSPENVKRMSVVELSICCKNTKNIYALCTQIMQNFIGQPTYPYLTQPKQLYPYILFLSGENADQSASKDWSPKELKDVQVTVLIKEGRTVHPKYSDFSRVYCKIWVEEGKEKYTSVKESNVDLLWDEGFLLNVPYYDTDMLTIEVWSTRPRFLDKFTKVLEKSQNGKEDTTGNYKIGDILYPIKELPCVGKDMLLPLKKGPRRIYTRGELSLFIQLSTKKAKDHVFHIHMYMELLKLGYDKQLPTLESSGLWKNWLEILPNPALTLIQQQALQCGITSTEQCVCSWLIASSLKVRQEDRFSFYFLHVLLEGLISDITADQVDPYLEDALYSSISGFSDYCIQLLKSLHVNFDVQNVEYADELFYLLRCMCSAEMKSYSNYLDSFDVIAEESHFWYLGVIVQHKEDFKDAEVNVQKMCLTVKKIVKAFLRNQIILDDIFTRAWSVSYSEITYRKLDQAINDAIKPIILHLMLIMRNPQRKRDVQECLKMLQLYHNVRNLINYVIHDLSSERTTLHMDDYSTWFGEELILEWFLLCDVYTSPFIKRAVIADNMEAIGKDVPHGSSVSDVTSIIDEMVLDVWLKMKWEEQFYTHAALIEAIRTCVLQYTDSISDRIKTEHFFCDKNNFIMNHKLCVALSNLFAIFEQLNITKTRIKSVLKFAETEYGFTVIDPMVTIAAHLHISIADIILSVLNEVDKHFKKLTKKVLVGMILSFATKSTALADTCSYMERVLELLYTNMKAEPFFIVLRQLWMIVVINFNDALSVWRGWAICILRRKSVYLVALQALSQLQDIFYCAGHGLSYTELRNQIYDDVRLKIESKLKIYSV